jgi:hypothetical protein
VAVGAVAQALGQQAALVAQDLGAVDVRGKRRPAELCASRTYGTDILASTSCGLGWTTKPAVL